MKENVPGKLKAIILLHLITGIVGVLGQGLVILGTCGVWLIFLTPMYALATNIMAIISGAKGLGQQPRHNLYKTVGIMQLIAILGGDVFSLVSGILTLVFLGDPEVQAFLAGDASSSELEAN